MRPLLRHIALGVLLLASSLSAGCTQNSSPGSGGNAGNTIKVGCFFSMTGGTATFGTDSMNGIRLAADEINAKGGVLGKKLDVIVEDDQGQQAQASAAAQKLIAQQNVDVVVGDVASSNSIAAAVICQQNKTPMLTPSSTNPEVTKKGNYIFRACFIDPFQGYVMARFALDNLKAKTAAIMTDKQSDYSQGLTKFFTDTFTKGGGKIVGNQSYIQNDADFKGQLTSLKGLNPDVIYVPGYYTDVGLIARQARDLGLAAPLLGGDGWDSPKLVEVGGRALDNCYYSVHVSPQSTETRVVAAVKAYTDKYGAAPDSLALLAYDSIYLLADAYQRAGSVDKEKLRDALAATKGFQGICGSITMNSDRDPVKPAVVVKVDNGKIVYAATIQPDTATAPK